MSELEATAPLTKARVRVGRRLRRLKADFMIVGPDGEPMLRLQEYVSMAGIQLARRFDRLNARQQLQIEACFDAICPATIDDEVGL